MKSLLFFIFLLSSLAQAENFDLYPTYLEGTSISGPCGYIQVPAPRTLGFQKYVFGIHRYMIKLNYGVMRNFECGACIDAEEASHLNKKELEKIKGNLKYHISGWKEIDAAAGVRGKYWWIAAAKYLPLHFQWAIQGGIQTWKKNGILYGQTILSLQKLTNWTMFMFDYDGKYHFGLRLFLAPFLKLDIFFTDLKEGWSFDNIYFGLNISEKLL